MKARLALVLLLSVSSARADETAHHVVAKGDSCSSIAQRYFGDARLVDLLHSANPELRDKPPPHVLREGMVLVIPSKPAPRTGPDAALTTVRNQVEVLNPDPKPAHANDPLFRGNRVSTEAASAADVTFRDETQVKLGERTLVIILGDARSAATRLNTQETTLVTGDLRAFMPRKDSSVAVGTDAANVRVFDGEAKVSADAVKTTRLSVYRGSSTIDARGRTREVARGFGSKAELGRQPTEPKPLPPAVAWTTLPPLVLVADTSLIVGEFALPRPDLRVAEWHVQVARDGVFRDVVVDMTIPSPVQRMEIQAPGPGRYYMRVSAIDDDRFEGPFSTVARTMVVKPTTTMLSDGHRQIALEPSDAFCVRVGNVPLTRIDRPFVARKAEPAVLRCAPNESDPTTLITVE